MKPEALDALTTQTMRPKALEAVTTPNTEEKSPARQRNSPHQTQDTTKSSSASSRSASDNSTISTDGTTEATPTAAAIVSEVVQTVKTAVDGAIAWAEQKVDKLGAEQDTTGPYTSPATCMPSDLDAIASGILPALPAARQYDGGVDDGGVDDGLKEADGTEKSVTTGDGEDVRK